MPNASNVQIRDASNNVQTVSTLDALLAAGLFINAGLPAGANQVGNVSVTAMPGLPAGSNQVGNVSVTTLPSVTIGSHPGLASGANQVGNVSITSMPAVTLNGLPSGANQVGNVSVTALPAVTLNGLPTGANTIGSVKLMDGAGTAVSSDLRGTKQALAVEIVDGSGNQVTAFGGTLSGGLPTGANTIGGVKLLDGSGTAITSDLRGSKQALTVEIVDGSGTQVTAFGGTLSGGLPTGANTIGSVKILDGSGTAITSDTRGAKQALTVEIVDGSGTQITSFGGTLSGGLPSGSNQIGNVSVTAMPAVTLNGLPTGANTIGQTIPLVNSAVLSATNPMPIYDAFLGPNTVNWTSATAANTALTLTTAGMDTVILTIVPQGTITAGAITFEAFDGTNWVLVKAPRTDSYSTDSTFSLTGSPGTHSWQVPVAGYPQFRARLGTAITGAGNTSVVGIVSSAPDVSIVTVGLDPSQALPAGTNQLGNVSVTALPALVAGTAQIGNVSVTALPAIPAGTNQVGNVSITTLPAVTLNGLPTGANTIGSVKITDGTNVPAVKAASTTAANTDPALVVTISPNSNGIISAGTQASPSTQWLSAVVAGDVASGSTDSGNPIKVGGIAKTANPTAVSDGQRVSALYDKLGKQITVGAIRALKGQLKTVIANTTETAITTGGATGVFVDLYGLVITNTSNTAVAVSIKDVSAGTARFTFAVPSADTRGFMLPVDSAVPQSTANSQWTATLSAAVSNVEITALTVQNL